MIMAQNVQYIAILHKTSQVPKIAMLSLNYELFERIYIAELCSHFKV